MQVLLLVSHSLTLFCYGAEKINWQLNVKIKKISFGRKNTSSWIPVVVFCGVLVYIYFYFFSEPKALEEFNGKSKIEIAKVYKRTWDGNKYKLVELKIVENKKKLDELHAYIKNRNRIYTNKKNLEHYLIYFEFNNGKKIELLFQVEKDFNCAYCIIARDALFEDNIMVTGVPIPKFRSEGVAYWLKEILTFESNQI